MTQHPPKEEVDPLQALWTSGAAPLDAKLTDRAAKSLARQRGRFRLEVIATAGVLAFWIVVLWVPNVGGIATLLAAASAAGLTFWWLMILLNFRGTWTRASMNVDGFVALERKRLQAKRRLTHLSLGSVAVFSIAVATALPSIITGTHAESIYRAEPWRLGVAGAILVVVVIATAVHGAFERKRIDASLRELG